MKVQIKKSELPVLKQAIRAYAWQLYCDKYIGDEFNIYENDISHSYKVSLLKNLAMLEKRIVDEALKSGYQKKKQYRCWWLWTTIDKLWYKTREAFNSKAEQKRVASYY